MNVQEQIEYHESKIELLEVIKQAQTKLQSLKDSKKALENPFFEDYSFMKIDYAHDIDITGMALNRLNERYEKL